MDQMTSSRTRFTPKFETEVTATCGDRNRGDVSESLNIPGNKSLFTRPQVWAHDHPGKGADLISVTAL
jgi:hypothetical protein